MAGVSVDFVGYTTGVQSGPPAPPVGFFSLFDGTGIPVGLLGDVEPPEPPAPPSQVRRGAHPFILPATRVVAEAAGLCDIRAEAQGVAVAIMVEATGGEAVERTVTVGAGMVSSTGRRRALQDDEDFLT